MNPHLETAQNLGFIARMNKKNRVPILDTRLTDYMTKNNCFTKDAKMYEAWLSGWDFSNLEYDNYSLTSLN